MAGPQFNKAIGGITPLGIITITAGTPQKITKNLNLPTNAPYTFACRQIGISVDSTPAGEVYLNYGNFAGKDTNATAAIIQSGTVQTFPGGSGTTEGEIDLTKWYLDGSASCIVAVYAVDATS